MTIAGVSRAALLAGILSTPIGLAAAQTATPGSDRDTVFILGRIDNGVAASDGETINAASISAEEMRTFDRTSLDEALDLIPGANASNTGGSRNEKLIFIRGFDRFQTTLSIDGVRVFLPADNRIDFARFLTADLAEVQISNGYVSVLDGPGGLGGAINLVTLKPTADFEAEAQASVFLDRDLEGEGHLLSGRLGGRSGDLYWQASGAVFDRDHFTLSEEFQPTVLENGGAREASQSKDWRINLKVGWQPNDTDEYSINYTRSEGEKNAPLHVRDPANSRFWSWPYWDIDSLAFLSRTQLRDDLVLRTRLYRNSFDNLLSAYDNAAQNNQTLPRAFDSYYSDYAAGGNVQLDWTIDEASSLRGVFFVRRDVHHERQDGFTRTPAVGSPSVNAPYSEPEQTNDEYTYSVAAEYARALSQDLDIVLGASYDWTDLKEANDVNVQVTGTTVANSVISFLPVNYALRDNRALNGQAALTWRIDEAIRAHVSVSSRARFPTVFERFSSRFGAAIPNPDVREERATSYEVGVETRLADAVEFSSAVFYSDLQDALIQIPVTVTGFGLVTQTKNAGDGRYYGFEASLRATLSDNLELGGNVTRIRRELDDPTNPAFQPQGVPDWKLFAYADWRPLPRLTLRPNIEYADERWTVTTTTPLTFYRTGGYVLVNLSADYDVTDKVRLTAAVQNLGDRNYQLTDGFPEAGRSFYASIRAKF